MQNAECRIQNGGARCPSALAVSVSMAFLLFVTACASAEELDAKQILEKVDAQYATIQTYDAQGTIVEDMNTPKGATRSETSFSMRLKKPNLYLISYEKKAPESRRRGAVWNADAKPFLYRSGVNAYWNIEGNDARALGDATGDSSGVAFTIPSLFLPVRNPHRALANRIAAPKLEKIEMLDGEECYVISGSSTVSKKQTLWISSKRFLILQSIRLIDLPREAPESSEMTDQEVEETLKLMGEDPTQEHKDGVRAKVKHYRELMKVAKLTGTICEHHMKISTPELAPRDFMFTVPEGTELREPSLGGFEMDEPDYLWRAMREGLVGAGIIRTALRVYDAKHDRKYPTLTAAKGYALAKVLGVNAEELEGEYLNPASFEVTSTSNEYTIKASWGAETYIIDHLGIEHGTCLTGQ